MKARPKKPSSETVCSFTTVVMPEDTNPFGNLFGGRLVGLMDQAAYICAARHSRRNCVTASIERVDFRAPVRSGFIVIVEARLQFVHRSSMEVGVKVSSENPITGERASPCSARFTFVALGDDGRPVSVPDLELRSEEERRIFREGRRRFEARQKHQM